MNFGDSYANFYDLLVSNNALEKFLHNTSHLKSTIAYHFPIDGFLTWSDTPEGHAYWKAIHRKQEKRYKPPITLNEFREYCEYVTQPQSYEYW